MATNFDKALYQAPEGMSEEDMGGDIEIVIEDPESVSIGLGDLEIDIEPNKEATDDFNANLAEFMEENELQELAGDLLSDFEDDIDSRKDWMQTYVDGLELLGMKIEERSEPWEGA